MRHNLLFVFMACVFAGCFSDPGAEFSDDESSTETSSTTGTDDTNDTDETDDTGESEEGLEPDMGSEYMDFGTDSDMDAPPTLPDAAFHYDFDGDFVDQAGDADGIPVGTINFIPSAFGSAAAFNNAYVDASAYTSFVDNLDAVTISVMYRANTNNGLRAFLALGDQGEDVSTNTFAVRLKDGAFEVVSETGAGVDSVSFLGDAPPAGDWQHVVFVFELESVSTYVNGEWVETTAYTQAETTSTQLWIGGNWTMHWFDGAIDDLQVFHTALDDKQAEYLSSL